MSRLISQFTDNESQQYPNLSQGVKFGFMQNAIISRELPNLPLMEQTTGRGIGSIIEPLDNSSPEPKSGTYNNVNELNENEMKKLNAMENEYQNLIAQLMKYNTQTQKTSQCIPNTKYANDKKWQDSCNKLNKNDCSKKTECQLDNNSSNILNKIQSLNKKINAQIQKLVKQTKITNRVNNTAKGDGSTHSNNLKIQLNTLMEKKSRLDALLTKRQTLNGQLEDRRLEMDSSYLHYIAFFLSAVTLGTLAFTKLAKN